MAFKKTGVTISLLVILTLLLSSCGDGKEVYIPFAQCLADKEVVMYGSFRCPHCLNQKKMFGSSFEKIKYVECDPLSRVVNKALCEEKKITGYPTWIFGDDSRLSGELTFEQLAEKSGCSLPDASAIQK